MARLPTPGADSNVWGEVLNEFLAQSLSSDGTLKADSVGASQIQSGAVTKSDVGLSNVDNTSDAGKPISTAAQTALDAKANSSDVGAKVLLIDNTASLPTGTPAGVVVVVKA